MFVNQMADSERKNGVQEFLDMKENVGTLIEMNYDASHGKANVSLVKGLTHSGSCHYQTFLSQ